jgi:hypothetical protein
MAAVMNTPSHARFDASFGAGGLRGPYLTPDPPSMVDQLPSIKFGFDDLRDRMARFTQRFDLFIDQGRKRVLEERNHFRINMSEIQGRSFSAMSTASLSMLTVPSLQNLKDQDEENSKTCPTNPSNTKTP